MTVIKLRGKPITSTLNNWRRIDSNTHRCGNVQVVRRVDQKCRYRDDLRIEIRNWRGEWIETYPVNRSWGYSGPGAAKRGAALMAASGTNTWNGKSANSAKAFVSGRTALTGVSCDGQAGL